MAEETPTLNVPLRPPMKCRSCPTMIVFAYSAATNKRMPFELDPSGEWEIRQGTAVHIGPRPPENQLELGGLGGKGPPLARYTSHHAKCPAAAQWRPSRG